MASESVLWVYRIDLFSGPTTVEFTDVEYHEVGRAGELTLYSWRHQLDVKYGFHAPALVVFAPGTWSAMAIMGPGRPYVPGAAAVEAASPAATVEKTAEKSAFDDLMARGRTP